MSWGYKILIVYGLFVGLMAALVIGSYQHSVNLVSKDYYEMELKYQDVLDGSKNYAAQNQQADAFFENGQLIVELPQKDNKIALTEVSVWFYNKVAGERDIRFDIAQTPHNRIEVPLSDTHKGRYLLKVQWKEGQTPYYYEKELNL
jgi:nitrogen fixation protein FixH